MNEYIAIVEEKTLIQIDFSQEIVRCRDCKWCFEYENKSGKKKWCRNNLRYVSDVGFCAWGERRES